MLVRFMADPCSAPRLHGKCSAAYCLARGTATLIGYSLVAGTAAGMLHAFLMTK